MTRRRLLALLSAFGLARHVSAANDALQPNALTLSEAQWRERLTPAQYKVLREEGTERAGSSPLDHERRKGMYRCAGCDTALFTSAMKFDSGTGWPSFHSTLPAVFATRADGLGPFARTEYHCARCGGHHGHVFPDGPKPSGLRYCNNGVALKFVPEASA